MKSQRLVFLAAVLALGACSPTVETRGNFLSDTQRALVAPQTSKRADVVNAWGPPTAESPFDANTWYYIGETTSQKGIYAPVVTARRLVRVTFDRQDNDTVTDVADIDPRQAREVEPVTRVTPTAGKEFTAVQQFLGNLGKYNTDKPKK